MTTLPSTEQRPWSMHPERVGWDALTPRERQVLSLYPTAPRRIALAKLLGIATDTLNKHVTNLLRKVDCESLGQASLLWDRRAAIERLRAASASVPSLDETRMAKALALIHVTGHSIKEAIEHWESYRSDATEIIAAYGACGDLPEYAAEAPEQGRGDE